MPNADHYAILFDMPNHRIYLDYASSTPIDPKVVKEIKKYSSQEYVNPSSHYKEGVLAKKVMAEGRKKIADFIHAHPDEIIFTSGGTEANNLALDGVVRAARMSGIEKPHIIISNIEHSSISETANMLEEYGIEVTRISVNHSGLVVLEELKKAVKKNTVLVSIMAVNNEIGTVQPIRDIAKIVRDARKGFHGSHTNPTEKSMNNSEIKSSDNSIVKLQNYPLLHTDAAQATLYQELFVEKLGVDLLTLDGTKMYGPPGTGCLFVKRNTSIMPIIQGGGQERGLRSGTENLPGIMGLAKALQIAGMERLEVLGTMNNYRNLMIEELKKIRADIKVNGCENPNIIFYTEGQRKNNALVPADPYQSPHILNVSIPGIDSEFFVLQLDAKGIACSTKSSCLRDENESYVLKAIGADSKTSVRFSFGRWTKKKDIKQALKIISDILSK